MYVPVPYLYFMVGGSVAAYVCEKFIRSTTTMERRRERTVRYLRVGSQKDWRHPRQLKRGKHSFCFFLFFLYVFVFQSGAMYRTVPIEQLVHELNKQGAEHVAQASGGFT